VRFERDFDAGLVDDVAAGVGVREKLGQPRLRRSALTAQSS
jgi:hypothetical protein